MRIKIKNFQSIEELEINGGPLILLKGPTNTGKTAVHRAIQYLWMGGRQNFERMLRHGKDRMEIELERDGHHIKLIRTLDGENTMVVDGATYTKIGTERPVDLAKAGYKLLELNRNWVMPQLATQHSKYFLVGEESDSVARAEALASTASKHLKGVIAASRVAGVKEKQAAAAEKFALEEAKRVERLAKQYEGVGDVMGDIEKLEAEEALIERWKVRLEKLRSIRVGSDRANRVVEVNKDANKLTWGKVPDKADANKIRLWTRHLKERKALLLKQKINQALKSVNTPQVPSGQNLQRMIQLATKKLKLERVIAWGKFDDFQHQPGMGAKLQKLIELNRRRKSVLTGLNKLRDEMVYLEREGLDTVKARETLRKENPACPTCGKEW